MRREESPRELVAFLRSLRAIRRYAPTPVPDSVIQDILEVGRWTGSAKNTQPWELLIVEDREMLLQLSTLGQFADHLSGAAFAVALIMASPRNRFDAGRLAEHLMLGAWAHGVGSCIASIFPEDNERRAKALLGVPADREMGTTIAFGYPADEDATRVRTSPERRSVLPSIGRRPLSAIAHRGHYGRPWVVDGRTASPPPS
jgi:nitroreductase